MVFWSREEAFEPSRRKVSFQEKREKSFQFWMSRGTKTDGAPQRIRPQDLLSPADNPLEKLKGDRAG